MVPLLTTEDVRTIGQELFFEYHCFESSQSKDAELWYHSHQQVTVLGFLDNDGWDIRSQEDRYECGCLIAYEVRFADGFTCCAMEDELLDSKDEYCRPDPPKKKRVNS